MCGSTKKSTTPSATTGPMPSMPENSSIACAAVAALRKRLDVAEMAREPARIGLADMANAERIEEAVEDDAAPRLDRLEEIARRGLAEAVPLGERGRAVAVALAQGEDVGGRPDAAAREEQFDLLVAEPLDVEGVARAEMLEALDRLRGADETPGAAAHHVGLAGLLVDLAQRRGAADRADVREFERLACPPAACRARR